jgi:prepilin-type N-terminal cleavage/methylation domain-containing protein
MRMSFQKNRFIRNTQRGFTLLEMVFAAAVLGIGLLGLLGLITTAIATNNRNKLDSTSTLLAQMTAERIATIAANATTSVTITDCNPSTGSASHTVSTTGSTTGAGANLDGSGNVDFTQSFASVTSGYAMLYYACAASTGDRAAVYDVRWNIKTLTTDAKLVTVSARRNGTSTSIPVFFAVPANLKLIVGL